MAAFLDSTNSVPHRTTFIATLGGQPQVVTLALDQLLALGVEVDEVILFHLHPSTPYYQRALAQVRAALDAGYPGLPHRSIVPTVSGHAIEDITNTAATAAVLRTLRDVLVQLKERQHTLHLAITGGRRILGVLAMAVAPLYFDHQDTMWHLYSPDSLRQRSKDGALMHIERELPTAEQPRLIRIPVVPWGEYLMSLRKLATMDIDSIMHLAPEPMDEGERARCEQVLEQLTTRQSEILHQLARGQKPDQVATHFNIEPTTVSAHSNAIYRACRAAWPQEPHRWTYHDLQRKFSAYYEQLTRQTR